VPVIALRSRERTPDTTRRAILAAAGQLLATRGEEGLAIRELCARAGVTAPTVYHHFGDKRALVDRVVNDCFAAFDRALARRRPPPDPVAALAWGFDRYLEYGLRHPTHYRLMFQRPGPRRTPAGLAAYDRLRRMVTAIADAGRLRLPVEDATAACWCAVHGITSLVVAGYVSPDAHAVAVVREAMLARCTGASRHHRIRPRGGATA
jgi:AcrR family transcriptional regulator